MKNNFIYTIFFVLLFKQVYAENLNIKSSNISIDKKSKITIFENDVVASDSKNNIIKTEIAEYDKVQNIFLSKGDTKLTTSEGFTLIGENILFDNHNKIIKSDNPAIIKDLEKNEIFLQQFEYSTTNNFFRSVGNISIVDANNNKYNFSQILLMKKRGK